MELHNEFVVPVDIEAAWALLTDVERIAPCMPGAELREVDGDDYLGVVKVRLGPITAQYDGRARFVKKDDGAHVAVLEASGREVKGQGNAQATITASLSAEDDGTRVIVLTVLSITGRAAQFGRGVMAEVSAKLLGQFVSCLEANVLAASSGPPTTTAPLADLGPGTGRRRSIAQPYSAQPVDLLDASGGAVIKRLLPLLLAAGVAVVIVRRAWRGRQN